MLIAEQAIISKNLLRSINAQIWSHIYGPSCQVKVVQKMVQYIVITEKDTRIS